MRPLSATVCIQPAIDRTKIFLFSPFRKGRTWKLCAASYACRFGSLYFPVPLLYLALIPTLGRSRSLVIALIVLFIAAFLVLFTWVFHLCSRLQFAYFDMLANLGEFVTPAWRKYREPALRWTFFKIATGSIFTAITAVPVIAWLRNVIPMLSHMKSTHASASAPEFAHTMAIFYIGYGLVVLLFGMGMLIFGLLGDFVLPSLALENTALSEAFRRMGLLIQQEPGEFALYVLLKTVLGLVGYFAAIIAWEIAFLIVSLLVGGVVLAVGFALHMAGVPAILLTILGVLLAIAWYGFAMYTMIFPVGIVITWMDAYALYFLGGRYPVLGDLLDGSTPPPSAPVLNVYAPAYPPPLPPTA